MFVEDLAVAGLGRTGLAKSVHAAGWSAFVGVLEYRAALHGRTFAKGDRAFPSSQICSACGLRDGPQPLHVREWMCGACGAAPCTTATTTQPATSCSKDAVSSPPDGDSKPLWDAGKTGTPARTAR
ncbi:transposase [Streptomyces sp. NPDC004074]|uniref:transposase n=1 Tax=Streptomyces sp. NPDC004074 TaxID=3154277 RepID=UPI0033B236F4